MNADWVRQQCLSFPQASEHVIWEGDLTFKVAGKMFAHTVLEVAPVWLSFKCSPEDFAELTERNGIIPAPYLARAQWVALETKDAVTSDELASLLRKSYDLVVAKLPKKTRENLSKEPARDGRAAKRSTGKGKTSAQKSSKTNRRPRK